MDGREATQAIRKLDRKDAKTIPIIAVSADAFEDSVYSVILLCPPYCYILLTIVSQLNLMLLLSSLTLLPPLAFLHEPSL